MVVGIFATLLLAGGTYFTTMSLKTVNAQASTLGEPILIEHNLPFPPTEH
jgi:hypothetical protein